jgi:hypothetical protein
MHWWQYWPFKCNNMCSRLEGDEHSIKIEKCTIEIINLNNKSPNSKKGSWWRRRSHILQLQCVIGRKHGLQQFCGLKEFLKVDNLLQWSVKCARHQWLAKAHCSKIGHFREVCGQRAMLFNHSKCKIKKGNVFFEKNAIVSRMLLSLLQDFRNRCCSRVPWLVLATAKECNCIKNVALFVARFPK